jgi:tryptophan synthase alpha chain
MLRARVEQLRLVTSKPLAVGFGIATPAQVASVAEFADGAVVGSALVELVAQAAAHDRVEEEVQKFCSQLAAACRR